MVSSSSTLSVHSSFAFASFPFISESETRVNDIFEKAHGMETYWSIDQGMNQTLLGLRIISPTSDSMEQMKVKIMNYLG